LPEVLKELARYTDKRIVLVSDPRLAPTIAGGAIGTRDISGALRSLQKIAPVRVVETDQAITIESRTNNEDKRNN
jgi:ferric-dicitrate binding protein FerR (iron transport regulator)